MLHLARDLVSKLTLVSIKYKNKILTESVYLPMVDGKPYLSQEAYDKIADKKGIPRNLPYTLGENRYNRIGRATPVPTLPSGHYMWKGKR